MKMTVGRSSQGPAGVPRNREKWPISTQKNESNLTRNRDIFEKMWFFLIRRLQLSLWSGYLRDRAARTEELQSAVETNATFSHKNPSISSNSTRFFGVKIGNFSLFLGTPAGPWDHLPTVGEPGPAL